jgi:GMP synthase-like glutamine amidotransferase
VRPGSAAASPQLDRSSARRILVVEHEADAGAGLVGEGILRAGHELVVVGPAAQREVPATPAGFDGVVVLGGTPGPTDDHAAAWLPAVRRLIRACLDAETPYLGICLGAQLLAVVAGGIVARAARGPELGLGELRLTAAAAEDPLLGGLPTEVSSLQWHFLEVADLPQGSTTLCSSDRCLNQAFRVGAHAWGMQFHLEATAATAEAWTLDDSDLGGLGLSGEQIVADVRAREADLRAWWSQLTDRWLGIVEQVGSARASH